MAFHPRSMQNRKFLIAALLLVTAAYACRETRAQAPASLRINAGNPTTPVSPTLYGLMTEEINHSYDGGLYAELVRNRTFRSDWQGVSSWYIMELGASSAAMQVDKTTGPSAALPQSLQLKVTRADRSSRAGILNEGYWGFAVHPDTKFRGSFFARTDYAGKLPVQVAIVDNQSGKALSTASVAVDGNGWKQYSFELTFGSEVQTSVENHLELTFDRPATLWLQLVSVFPPTYHDRENGNRIDLMEKLAGLHPAFLRFPGGNYVEGTHIEDRFDWKKTIGPLVDRPTHESPWSYHSSDGMGLLEFLEWCEDLKIEPVLAVYAGYSLSGEMVKPGSDLEPYVQDALDEIEYVTGSTDTQWGKERARDGHPSPFRLRYVEIGNEDFFDKSGSYEQRFAQFQRAIKAKYPELQLIATTPVKESRPDLVDDHYYLRAVDMFREAAHYDKADRTGPKIFVGEWATREGTPTPNFGAALGDAAWMTGLERNSDLVVMAAYAPLLVNVNPGAMQWDTDLIGFNTLTNYASPSYYAQSMFASCLGDHTLESSMTGAGDRIFYSITASQAAHKACLKIVNASSTQQPIHISFDGIGNSVPVRIETLKADSTQATNTITEPDRIRPISSSMTMSQGQLPYVLPGYSIQLFEIDLTKR